MTIMEILKILSDTNRLRILNLLYRHELCVCELEYLLNISQSNLSKHLRLMSEAGLLENRRQNKFAYYKICDSVFTAHAFLEEVLKTELKKEEPFGNELVRLRDYQNSELTCHSITMLVQR